MYSLVVRYKKQLSILFGLILSAAVITYIIKLPQGTFFGLSEDLTKIDPSEGLEYSDLDGKIIKLTDFTGKPLIINSWASWTPFSASELKLFEKIKTEYEGRITVLAINRMEHPDVIRAYLAAYQIEHNLLFVVDPGDTFYKAIGGYAMPETVFYNKDGNLISRVRGVITEEELRNVVEQLLTE